MQRLRNAEVTASSLVTTIFEQTSRGVQYQLYPIDSSCGFTHIKKMHKGLLAHSVIDLLQKVNDVVVVTGHQSVRFSELTTPDLGSVAYFYVAY